MRMVKELIVEVEERVLEIERMTDARSRDVGTSSSMSYA
jgi:hypothetical protein